VGVRYKASYINELYGDKPYAVPAFSAAFSQPQIATRAVRSHIRDSMVGVYGSERIIGYVYVYQSSGLKKSRFSGIGLPGQPYR
jgi:hypothetical protein